MSGGVAAGKREWRVRARERRQEGLDWETEGVWTGPFLFVQAADTQLGMIHSFAC